jgi:XTP/dITP diphosphohydrolase
MILDEPKGHGGFGYDTLFYLPDLHKTFAELTIEEKELFSHRGKALRKAKDVLRKLFAGGF